MIVPVGVTVHLARDYAGMRKAMDGPVMPVRETLKKDPFSGIGWRVPETGSETRIGRLKMC